MSEGAESVVRTLETVARQIWNDPSIIVHEVSACLAPLDCGELRESLSARIMAAKRDYMRDFSDANRNRVLMCAAARQATDLPGFEQRWRAYRGEDIQQIAAE